MMFPFYDIDFFNYIELMDVLKSSGNDLSNIKGEILQIEWPYYYIGSFVNYNYILFRLVVWGGAMALYGFTMKRLGINSSVFILYFTIISLLLISYGRVTLAWAIAFFGYSFIVKPLEIRSNLLSYCIGVILIICSVIFHKTAILLPVVFLLSSIKLNRTLVIVLLLAFPFLVQLTDSQFLLELLSMSQDDSGILNVNTAQYYMTIESGNGIGIAALIQEVLRIAVFYGFALLCIQRIFHKKDTHNEPIPIKSYMDVALWIIYISSIFAFTTSVNTSRVYYRFLNFAVFPMTLCLSQITVSGQQRKQVIFLSISAVIYTIYRLLYAIYLSI